MSPRLDPAVADVRSAVRAALTDLPAGSTVLVACSGGADSLALAAATAFVAPRAGWRAGAVVVDHGWFAGSADVAAQAAAVCRALGLDPVDVATLTAHARGGGGGGPEGAARDARYAALASAAQHRETDVVLLGHTLDDQAETVLLGLARGSGPRSLAGMPARRGIYCRPMLALTRATTVRACAALGLRPWDDPANGDPAYARSRVRASIAVLDQALGPGLVPALARTAELAREDCEALDAAAASLLDAATICGGTGIGPPGEVCLDVTMLAGAPDAVRRRALLAAARSAGSPGGALSRRHALALDILVVGWRGQGPVGLPGRVVARRVCGTLALQAQWPAQGVAEINGE